MSMTNRTATVQSSQSVSQLVTLFSYSHCELFDHNSVRMIRDLFMLFDIDKGIDWLTSRMMEWITKFFRKWNYRTVSIYTCWQPDATWSFFTFIFGLISDHTHPAAAAIASKLRRKKEACPVVFLIIELVGLTFSNGDEVKVYN